MTALIGAALVVAILLYAAAMGWAGYEREKGLRVKR